METARALTDGQIYPADCASCPGWMRGLLGHDQPPTGFYRTNLVTGEPLARCPVRTLQLAADADPALYAEAERHRAVYFPAYDRHGVLPKRGGLAEQDARTVEYFLAIEMFRAIGQRAYDAALAERERERERGAGRG